VVVGDYRHAPDIPSVAGEEGSEELYGRQAYISLDPAQIWKFGT
jgi:hypothetical protein